MFSFIICTICSVSVKTTSEQNWNDFLTAVAKVSPSISLEKVFLVYVNCTQDQVIEPRINFVFAAYKTNNFEYRTFFFLKKTVCYIVAATGCEQASSEYPVEKITLSSAHNLLELLTI